jgi:hypothetical protein
MNLRTDKGGALAECPARSRYCSAASLFVVTSTNRPFVVSLGVIEIGIADDRIWVEHIFWNAGRAQLGACHLYGHVPLRWSVRDMRWNYPCHNGHESRKSRTAAIIKTLRTGSGSSSAFLTTSSHLSRSVAPNVSTAASLTHRPANSIF